VIKALFLDKIRLLYAELKINCASKMVGRIYDDFLPTPPMIASLEMKYVTFDKE
jgi:hypothetical protein